MIQEDLAKKIIVLGDEYRHNAPGGIAAVLKYYAPHFKVFKYIPTFKSTSWIDKLLYVGGAYLRLYAKCMFSKNIKIVHIHTAADGSFWMNANFLSIAKSLGKKVILHIHASRFKDFYTESNRKSEILLNLQLADKVIVLSTSWKQWFKSIGIAEYKLEILHNITEYPTIMQVPKNEKVNFLFLGEIGHRKGVFDILTALKEHKQEIEDKIILHIGGNKQEEKIRAVIKAYGLEGCVKFYGFVHGRQKIELLNKADVYILPSYNEGLPISILEAMSYGCAIISTPVGGIPEVVLEKNGILVQPGNIIQIYNAIKALTNKGLITQMGEESKCVVKAYYPDAVMAHLETIYNSLL